MDFMAGTTGLEPATSAVTGQRSNQLSYVPSVICNCFSQVTEFTGFSYCSLLAYFHHFYRIQLNSGSKDSEPKRKILPSDKQT